MNGGQRNKPLRTLPQAPNGIQKGIPLKLLLSREAIECLAQNILCVHKAFPADEFCQHALDGLEPLELMQRAHLAVTPGRDFGDAAPQRYIRFSTANSMAQLEEAVHRLERVL